MIDRVSPRRVTGPQVKELRDHYWDMMPNTRARATSTRMMLSGKMGAIIPGSLEMAGAQAWLGDLPAKRTNPQRIKQTILSKELQIRRPVTAAGYSAQSVSSRLEQPLDAIMRDRYAGFPDADITELLLLEGLAFSTVAISMLDWNRGPTLYSPGGKEIERRFRLDSHGKLEGDAGYGGLDHGRARRAHQAEQDEYLSRHVPFRQRAFSIRQCAPIFGPNLELEGLIIRTYWSAQSLLRRKFIVTDDKDGNQLYPLGAISEGDPSQGNQEIEVTEAWLIDEDEKPYVTFCVDGKYTWKEGEDGLEPHIIDLSRLGPNKDKALTRLPISWGWGMSWASADLDERAMGYSQPFEQSWRNLDSIMTSLVMWCMWRGTPGLIEQLPPGEPPEIGLEDDEEEQVPDFQPGKITKVRGTISEVATQGIAPGVIQAMQLMMSETKNEGLGNAPSGANSGFQMSLGAAFEQDAMTTVLASRRRMYAENASFILEGGKLLGEAYTPVRIYQIADVLLTQKSPSSTDQVLQLDPGLVGSSFWVEAVELKKPGENPAVRQQNAALVKEKLMTTRKFLEEDGDQSPEATVAEIQYETIMQSPEGMQAQIRILEQYVSDLFVKQIAAAIHAGEANPENGQPVGFAQGLSGPRPNMLPAGPQASGGMGGLQVGNPASASLNATVGAAMQTGPTNQALAAGGVMPSAPLSSGG